MIVLAVETASTPATIALLRDDLLLGEFQESGERGRADAFAAELAAVFERAQVRPRDVDLFAAGTGPGSFTGLRVGLAVAKALALALARPVIGVDALEVAAWRALSSLTPEDDHGFTTAVGGQKSEIYAATFRRTAKGIERADPNRWPDRWVARPELFEEHGRGLGRIFCTPDLGRALGVATVAVSTEPSAARIVATLAGARFAAGDPGRLDRVQAIYVKPVSIGGRSPEWSS